MPRSLMRQVISSLLPPGAVWDVALDEGLDKYFNGQALNLETVRAFLSELADVRNPSKTAFLSDLEREYGISSDERLSEFIRRAQLSAMKYSVDGTGSDDNLQTKLQASGFDLQVHNNSPAVDPSIFLDQAFRMVAGGPDAFAGNIEALCGTSGGELLVNGDVFSQEPDYDAQAGGSTTFAGNSSAQAGFYIAANQVKIEYEVPVDPDGWPFVFFVGGDAIRNGAGELINIELADVPAERQQALVRTILKTKPLHSWCGLMVTYT